MRSLLETILVISALVVSHAAFPQGWVAEIDIDLNHDLYALEKINSAVLTFSGVKASGSSATSQLHFSISGNDPMSGSISLSVSGIAWEPYDRSNPASEPVSASFSGSYSTPCQTGFFQRQGESPQEQIYIWIKIYPRLQISSFLQKCDEMTLTSATCSPRYIWEVSDSPTGGFKMIAGKIASSIKMTREELVALGFADPYGRKYFRVTGLNKTTSPLQAIDVYYPGPAITVDPKAPRCHNGNDGSVSVDITTTITAVNDFVVTLFSQQSNLLPLKQEVVLDGSSLQFNALPPGAYVVRVENATNINTFGNCWNDLEFQVINPQPVSISAAKLSDFNGYHVRCHSGQDGRIEVDASGGTGTYPSFEWIPSVSSSNIASNLQEGVYQVKVRDSNDCWSTPVTYRLTAPSALVVSLFSAGGANGFDVSCHDKADGSIQADVSGGVAAYHYQWDDGSSEPVRDGLPIGMYTLQVTDRNGCIVNDQITLNAPSPLGFKINEISGITCAGYSSGALEVVSTVNAIGTIAYQWSTGEQYQSIQDKPPGAYSVTVTDEQGCSAIRTHVLEDVPIYSVQIQVASDYNGSAIRCHGDSSGSLTTIVKDDKGNTASADSYTWYKNGVEIASGLSTHTMTELTAGIYRAEIRYRSECRAENTFILHEPTPVSSTITNTSDHNGSVISCAGARDGAITASATGGTGNDYKFLWNNGQTTAALVNIGAGRYSVVVTDANGCSASADRIVEEPVPVTGQIEVISNYHGQPLSCTNAEDGRIKGSAQGGTPPFSYEWNSGQTTSQLSGIGAGFYKLSIRDVNGCTTSVQHTLVNPEPVVAMVIDSSDYDGFGVSCNESHDGFLLAAASGGTGGYSYQWNDQPNASPRYAKLRAGQYTVTISDQNGCSHSVTRTIKEPPRISVLVSNVTDVSCHGGNDGRISLEASGGTGKYKFSNDGLNWRDDPVTMGLKSGTYEIFTSDSNGCQQTSTASVSEPNPITISFQDITPALCGEARGAATSVVSGGTKPYSFRWTNATATVAFNTSSISGLSSGIYTLSVTDKNHCNVSRPVAISATDGPKVEVADVKAATCSYSHDGGATIAITEGFGPFAIAWTTGATTPIASNLAQGEYLVEIKDTNNCRTVKEVTIPGPDSLRIEILETVEPTCHGSCDGKISLAATGGNGDNSFRWTSATGPTLDQLCAGVYTVTVSDIKQCNASRTIKIGQPEQLKVDLLTLRPPTCYQECDGALEIITSGGTGDLHIVWSNGNTDAAISNLCAGTYHATISDANLCEVTSTFTLEEPQERSVHIGDSAVICDGQVHTLDAGPSWKRFVWTSSTGFRSSNRMVSISEAGTYWLEAFDQNNCVARDTFLLVTSPDLLKPDFLMSSEVHVGDTLVIIDISWPLPESVSWDFPDEMHVMSRSGDIVFGEFTTAGQYDVTLLAALGECRDAVTKQLVVLDQDKSTTEEGRIANDTFVEDFSLYPNPNEGVFDVAIELQSETPIRLAIWNALTSRMVAQINDAGSSRYLKHFDLRPLSAGPYTLRLDYRFGTRYIRFIVR